MGPEITPQPISPLMGQMPDRAEGGVTHRESGIQLKHVASIQPHSLLP